MPRDNEGKSVLLDEIYSGRWGQIEYPQAPILALGLNSHRTWILNGENNLISILLFLPFLYRSTTNSSHNMPCYLLSVWPFHFEGV